MVILNSMTDTKMKIVWTNEKDDVDMNMDINKVITWNGKEYEVVISTMGIITLYKRSYPNKLSYKPKREEVFTYDEFILRQKYSVEKNSDDYYIELIKCFMKEYELSIKIETIKQSKETALAAWDGKID